uniref:coniferyl alcohol acyltransferase-like n=1 Tax=Erigeron canadensis TaxID=72917 RepID=UPI001CB89FDC|nr:coniferyl alcohol acyltransferase-like [Erigeron canadensis]
MRKIYQLLTLKRSKGLVSSTRRAHQASLAESQNLCRDFQPLLPSPPSTFSNISTNTFNRNPIFSHHFLESTRNIARRHYNTQRSTLNTSAQPLYDADSTFDYEVTIKGREVISADSSPANEHWLPLSNLDLLLPPIEIGVYFCYKKKKHTNMSPETVVNTMKNSLAKVLSTYYTLAGEIVPNSQGEPEVVCNNRGVEFVHARADIDLKDLDFYNPDETVKGKLVPKLNHGVLAVQATELNCGSIIISCATNHQVTDGYSLNMFLTAWAKCSQFETISSIPSFRPSVLNARHPPRYEPSIDNLYIPISSLPPPSTFKEPLYSRMYYIRAESIERLQSEASTNEAKRSKLLSFTAYLWKLLAHEGNDSANGPFRMGIVVDGRRFLTNDKNSPLLSNHFGNVVSVPYGVANHSDLKEMPLHEVAKKVQKFVAEATNEEHFRGLIDWVELHRPQPALAKIYFGQEKTEGEAVVVSSGQGLPINEMDFGWGKPDFGSYHVPWGSRTGYITTMPSATRKGDWVVYMHLKQKDLDVIENMAANVFTPLSTANSF